MRPDSCPNSLNNLFAFSEMYSIKQINSVSQTALNNALRSITEQHFLWYNGEVESIRYDSLMRV